MENKHKIIGYSLAIEAGIVSLISYSVRLISSTPKLQILSIALPIVLYLLLLARGIAWRSGNHEEANSVVPYLSIVSEIAVVYSAYNLYSISVISDLRIRLVTIILSLPVVVILIDEVWLGNYLEDATKQVQYRIREAEEMPNKNSFDKLYLSLLEDLKVATESTSEREVATSRLPGVLLLLVIFLFILSVVFSPLIFWFGFLGGLEVMIALLILKSTLSYLFSFYGSVEYTQLMRPKRSIMSLWVNSYLLYYLLG
jgi:hypothetical protein